MNQRDVEKIVDWWFYTIVIAMILFFIANIALSYPDPNSLSPDMQWLIYDLTAEPNDALRPAVELAYKKKKALERSDLNHDGTVDMQDFSLFSADYSLFRDTTKMVELPESQTVKEPLPFYGDSNQLRQWEIYFNYLAGAE